MLQPVGEPVKPGSQRMQLVHAAEIVMHLSRNAPQRMSGVKVLLV